jgi:hypothetical protein
MLFELCFFLFDFCSLIDDDFFESSHFIDIGGAIMNFFVEYSCCDLMIIVAAHEKFSEKHERMLIVYFFGDFFCSEFSLFLNLF